MSNGWISLHRKIRSSAVYSDPELLKLWIHCLLKVTHAEYEQLVGNKKIILQPGQFVTGRDALADEYNRGAQPSLIVKPLSLWRRLKTLENMEMLNIKTTNKFSVVTVVNWIDYQQSEQQMNNKRTTNEQQMNTNNNSNNSNNKNKQTSSPKFSTSDMKNAELLFEKMVGNNPEVKNPSLDKWASDFRLIREVDKRTDEQIEYLIKWTQADDFWKTNVLSPSKLRKQWDQLVIKAKTDHEKKKGLPYKPNEQPSPKYKLFNEDDYLRSE